MKTIGVFLAALVALATTSALSLRSSVTPLDLASEKEGGGGGPRDAAPRGQPPARVGDNLQQASNVPAVNPLPAPAAEGLLDSQAENPPLATAADLLVWDHADSDGALNACNTTIDLRLAKTGSWNDQGGDVNGDGRGDGIYDPEKWAVVFKYSSVTISCDVGFTNHPTYAPVVWLVSGDVHINGSLWLIGGGGLGCNGFANPGPGGFRGGRGADSQTPGAGGFGPGGGEYVEGVRNSGGSYGTRGGSRGTNAQAAPTYGNTFIIPLIGGSGGGASFNETCQGGGGGGGAILIVAAGTITVDGTINAYSGPGNGGAGQGSGGAIRLIANYFQGRGNLNAMAYYQETGDGRLFVQTATGGHGFTGHAVPTLVGRFAPLEGAPIIWPDDIPTADLPVATGPPSIRSSKLVVIDRLSGNPVDKTVPQAKSTDPVNPGPLASVNPGDTDTKFDTQVDATLHIEADNVPLDWSVVVHVVPKEGDSFMVNAPHLVAAPDLPDHPSRSTTTAQLPLSRGIGVIQVRAFKPTP